VIKKMEIKKKKKKLNQNLKYVVHKVIQLMRLL
jgi:hypothetical protein